MGLEKIKIQAYTDKKLSKLSDEYSEFVIPINPENYGHNRNVQYDSQKAQNNQGTNPKYVGTNNESIKLDFILDGTGTVEGYTESLRKQSVAEQIDIFLNTVYFVEPKIHKPKFLKISWGKSFIFDCILNSLDINYTLFNSDGTPLRAKLNASFNSYIEPEKRVLTQDFESADLTHVRQVTAGDKLTLMTYDIYGDASFYTQVASVNNLTSFRNLEIGNDLIFPPIQKKND